MIYKIGSEYTGIISLYTSILSVLSLTELGFSNAMVYFMYKPIEDNNSELLCSLLNLYKKIYYIIGSIILTLGLIILYNLTLFIKGPIPQDTNIYVLFSLYLINSVMSYYMYSYKSSLITAYQRNDIISKIRTVVMLFMYFFQIIALTFENIYLYAVILIISTIVSNYLYDFYSKKFFPNIYCKGKVTKDILAAIKKKVAGLLLYKLSSTTRTSLDSIVISSFLGLILLTKYQNYFLIVSSVLGFFSVAINAITASVGNSIIVKNVEDNFRDFKKLLFIYMCISGVVSLSILILLQPFILWWVGRELILDYSFVVLFVMYLYVQTMGDIVFLYRTATGLWWEDRLRPICETCLNLLLNILLVQLFGLYGVIGSTLLTLFCINFFWGAYILFRYYFKTGIMDYFSMQFKQLLIFFLCMFLAVFILKRDQSSPILLIFSILIIDFLFITLTLFAYRGSNVLKDAKDFINAIFNKIRFSF